MADSFKPAPGSCKGKVPHDTPAQARAAIVSVQHRRGPAGGELSVYHCQHCDRFHWGHTPGTRRTMRRAEPYKRKPKHPHRVDLKGLET